MTTVACNATNYFSPAKWVVSSVAGQGTHSTLAAAMAVAVSGDTIYLVTSTTENVTLKPGVNIVGPSENQGANAVTITGTLTMSGAGTCSIFNANLVTNSNYALVVSGSAASVLNLYNCYLSASSNSLINYTSSSASSQVQLWYCNISLANTYTAVVSTGAGLVQLNWCNQYGTSTAANTTSACSITLNYCIWTSPITTSSTGGTLVIGSTIGTVNATAITAGGSGTHTVEETRISSGSASAISVSSGNTLSISRSAVNSSNTNAITGLGTLDIWDVAFTGSSSTINTTTVNAESTNYIGSLTLGNALTVPNGGTGAGTLTGVLTGNGTSAVTAHAVTQYGVMVGGSSNAVATISVGGSNTVLAGGGASANPSFTGYPEISGLGIGASPGSTAGLTFDGSNFLSTYTAAATWTPNVQVGGSSSGITYSAQDGYYVQIGQIVYFYFEIVLSSKGSNSGVVSISNFPVTLGAHGGKQFNVCGSGLINSGSAYTTLAVNGGNNSAVLNFYVTSITGATQGTLPASSIGNSFNAYCNGFFIII